MSWGCQFRRWSALGVTVLALSGGLWFAKQSAESRVLTMVLGPQAETSALQVHWARQAACAENISIPLGPTRHVSDSRSRLTADRLWFTYDASSLLMKRLLIPRVVIDGALIESRAMHTSLNRAQTSTSDSGSTNNAASSNNWVTEVREHIESLEQSSFVNGTQVAVDAAMLTEQWRGEFTDVRDRAQRILGEARDIQQQLAALDNVLRHEGRVVASRDRLESLRLTLVAMKGDLSKADRKLRDQQSRLREALLIEKHALHDSGARFRAADASSLARSVVEQWLAASLCDPARISDVLVDLLNTPSQAKNAPRGRNIRFADQHTPDVSVASAQISGTIELDQKKLPFKATGNFQADASHDTRSLQLTEARWQMSVGDAACLSLDARAIGQLPGSTHVLVHSTAPGQIRLDCDLSPPSMRGSGQFQLRQWISQTSCSQDLCGQLERGEKADPLMHELIDQAISDLDAVPELIKFRFTRSTGNLVIEPNPEATRWLSDELTRLASERVAGSYESVAARLERRIHRDIDGLNQFVAVARDEASQHISQMLDELRLVQANVLNNLQHRAGVNFARRPSDDNVH